MNVSNLKYSAVLSVCPVLGNADIYNENVMLYLGCWEDGECVSCVSHWQHDTTSDAAPAWHHDTNQHNDEIILQYLGNKTKQTILWQCESNIRLLLALAHCSFMCNYNRHLTLWLNKCVWPKSDPHNKCLIFLKVFSRQIIVLLLTSCLRQPRLV